ncbi:MAG: thioredoxin domain-containing protein [Halolamina sp.]
MENRLGAEASPYLRDHADNPVHWQPWDERALAAARERDVPIFLSVGYSACHWCHVMAEESFEDEAVADLLNEHFVPVKVDREERPDLDRVYQAVCQLVTGGGGWPLSAFLTPDGRPFYVGTYFPKEPPDRRNVPGFEQLLGRIADSWRDPDQRVEMDNRADQWTEAVRDRVESTPKGRSSPPTVEVVDEVVAAALRSADETHGGFGTGQKFPQPARVEALLRAGVGSDDPEPLGHAVRTLDAMADGGLYDQLGGGFHRYCVDRDWTVPHFEKMLYDNATLARTFLDGHRVTGDRRYATVAEETLAFLDRELRHPDGGFYATLDAESETPATRLDDGESPAREEGAFYVWTSEEVEAVLDEPTASLAAERFGVAGGGNFEGGTTVLQRAADIETLADRGDLDVETARDRLETARTELLAARADRPRPPRDEKVLAGWNGLAVSAFADGALALERSLGETAAEALSFVREHMWDASTGRVARRYKDGDVKGEGYLEDYAFLARGALDTYGATGDVEHLSFALDLAETVVDAFYDPEAGTLYSTPVDGEELVARPQELADQSTPSPVGVAVDVLLDAAPFEAAADADEGFRAVAEDVLATVHDRVRGDPLQHASLALASAKLDRGPLELTLAADDYPERWVETLGSRYLPNALLAPRPATDAGLADWLDELGLDSAPPVWADRGARDGESTVYACRNRTCSPPTADLDEAIDWAPGNADDPGAAATVDDVALDDRGSDGDPGSDGEI